MSREEDKRIKLLKRLLREEMFQASNQVERFLNFQTNDKFAGIVKAEIKSNEIQISHRSEVIFHSQCEGVEQKNVFRYNKGNETVKYNLKPEVVYEVEKVRYRNKHKIAEIGNEVEMKLEFRSFVEFQWRIYSHSLYVYEKSHEKEDWVRSCNAHIKEQIQSQWSDVYQLESELDKEIEELWRLTLKHSKRMYKRQERKVSCLNALIKKNVRGECNGILQNRIWNPSKLRLQMKCDDRKYY